MWADECSHPKAEALIHLLKMTHIIQTVSLTSSAAQCWANLCQISILRWFVTEHPVCMILSSLWWTTGSGLSFFFFFLSRHMSSFSFEAKPRPLSPAKACTRKALPPLKKKCGREIWKGLRGNIKRQSELRPNPQATWRTLSFKSDNVTDFTSY